MAEIRLNISTASSSAVPETSFRRFDKAARWVRRMPGGSQSHLILSEEGKLFVVKFSNNPQHQRVLINEFIMSRICEEIGVTVPSFAVIEVDDSFVANNGGLAIDHGRGRIERCKPGRHFGSLHAGLIPGRVSSTLDMQDLCSLPNLREFWGMLAVDKWLANTDQRQAIFMKRNGKEKHRVAFIDHGGCFDTGNWAFRDLPCHGMYPIKDVYREVRGLNSFDPWLYRIENFDAQLLYRIFREIPEEWCENNHYGLDQLLEGLVKRRSKVSQLIQDLRKVNYMVFPLWHERFNWPDSALRMTHPLN